MLRSNPFWGLALIALFLLSCSTKNEPTEAQNKSPSPLEKAIENIPAVSTPYQHQVMVLGTFHFDRSRDASDVIAQNQLDISEEQSQQQLLEIVDQIATQFKPTLIAVEWMPRVQKTMDSLYQAYLKGEWELKKNEAFQLGFRIAKQMGLPNIHCVDNRPPQPDAANEIDDWDLYAEELGQTDLWHEYDADNLQFNNYVDSLLSVLDLKSYLRLLNSDAHSNRYKQLFLTGLVNLGAGDSYMGADLTGNWYRRNTRILVNTRQACKSTQERILVIYGSGHKWALDELFEGSPEFDLVHADPFLQ